MKYVCPICDDEIVDATASRSGEDSIQCDGKCATWLHRRCAGLSKAAFQNLVTSGKISDPFYCPMCRLDQQELEIKSLRDLVGNLSNHLSLIADELTTLKCTGQTDHNSAPKKPSSYAAVVGSDGTTTCGACEGPSRTPNYVSELNDRKFNIIVRGLKECDKGTPRSRRETKDFSDICDVLSSVDNNISGRAP